ncbi:hypothetical protein M569_03711, partial [Genlisea aurea]
QVLVEKKSCALILTLNRPKQLNALSAAMACVSCLLELFLKYEEDSSIKMIILKGKGRSFCAGGDVASAVSSIAKGDCKTAADFFMAEYVMNYVMATYGKPQISFLNGLVMGGGAGASVHGRFRISTEKTLFAMPETALGLFPDVGASYFLSRLPGYFGEYVGLTGARLDGAEMLACGLSTHFVQSEKLSSLEEALIRANSAEPSVISSVIDQFSHVPALKQSSAYHRLSGINKCFSRRSVEEIIEALEREGSENEEEWISSAIQSLKKASPMSLKISLRSMRQGRLQGVGKCLIQEFRMVCHVVRGETSKDFLEGCRAILLDKDKNPKWEPAKLEDFNDQMVERYFFKVKDEGWEDLKLPQRSPPPFAVAKL